MKTKKTQNRGESMKEPFLEKNVHEKNKSVRIPVTFTVKQAEILEQLAEEGNFGTKIPSVIQGIVILYLYNRGLI